MKFKKIMLVSMLLLAILTIGAVSAEDTSDNLTAVDDLDEVIESPDEVDVIADDNLDDEPEPTGTEVVNMAVEFPKEVVVGKEYVINVTFDKKVTGDVKVECDSYESFNEVFGENSTSLIFKTYDFGAQRYQVKYCGDATYAPRIITGEFTASGYVIGCDVQNEIYGQATSVTILAPNAFSNDFTVIVNGKDEYKVSRDEDGEYSCEISGLKYGANVLEIIYHDDSFDYNGTFNVTTYPGIIMEAESLSEVSVYLLLPSDATGTLKVYKEIYSGEDFADKQLLSSAQMKNGRASVILTDLAMGTIDLFAEYVGDAKYDVESVSDSVDISPQIKVPELVLPGKDTYAEINLPKGTSGTFILSEIVWDEELEDYVEVTYRAEVTDGYGKIKLNQLTNGYHPLNAQFKDGAGNIINSTEDGYEVRVINANSMTIIEDFEDGDTLLSQGSYAMYLPDELNGTAKIFVDGKLIKEFSVEDSETWVTLPALTDGSHKILVNYTGSDCSFTKEISFKALSCIIDIPDEIDVALDDIKVDLSENATGTLEFYVDGKSMSRTVISGSDNLVDISGVTMGTHKVKVTFTDNATGKTTSKEKTVEFDYSIIIDSEGSYAYGGDNEIRVSLPSDVTGDITITIDGKKRKWTSDGYGIIVNISDLSVGSYDIAVVHSGDKKYPKHDAEESFEVVGKAFIPAFANNLISLTLPSSVKGNLILEIYDITGYEEYDIDVMEPVISKQIALVKGKATYDPSGLDFGNYYVVANFEASDDDEEGYYVEESDGEMRSGLYVDGPTETFLNNASTIVIEAPDKGTVKVTVGIVNGTKDGEFTTIPVNSSVLTDDEYTFISQQLGKYQIHVDYIVDGEIVGDDDYYIDVLPDEVNIPDDIVPNKTSTVSMNLPSDATGNITVNIYTYETDEEGEETRVLNRTVTSEVIDGVASVDLPDDLDYDDYVLEVNYTGNKGNYYTEYYSSVVPYVNVPESIAMGDGSLEFDAEGLDGDVEVSVQGKTVNAKVVGGKVNMALPSSLSHGSGDVVIKYTDKNGAQRSISKSIYVKNTVDVNVKYGGTVTSNLIVRAYLSNRFETGNVTVKLSNGVEKTAVIESGYATFDFGKLPYGTYAAEVTYNGNDRTNAVSKNVTVKVTYDPVIKASNAKVYYHDGKYSIILKGYDGKVAKGTYVVFKINGKTYKKVKTNSKGVATIKLSKAQIPKTYKITVTALGKSVTKKITVKQVLTLKTVKVKKSAKKLVLTATLKKGKKAIKGKKITFKFNGKTYKAKTNKKGIAKVTVKKSVLKKLKVGKKIKYQATYLKDTVKKSAKVKK